MSVLVEFSLRPLDKGASVGDHVAKSLEIIDRSGVPYELHAMGTILEGDWDRCMDVVKECYEKMSEASDRVSVDIRVDARKGKENRLGEKVKSVEERLGKELKTQPTS